MTVATQAEFARIAGYGRTRITQLKQAGRLVMADDKHVDVEASLARIAETQGGRVDVAERHAAARVRQGRAAPPVASRPSAPPNLDAGLGADEGAGRARAKGVLMQYENALLKIEVALRRGLRFDLSAVRRESAGLGAMLRAGIERAIDQTAPRLAAAQNELQRRQILETEIRQLKRMVKREMARALRRMKAAHNLQKKPGDAA